MNLEDIKNGTINDIITGFGESCTLIEIIIPPLQNNYENNSGHRYLTNDFRILDEKEASALVSGFFKVDNIVSSRVNTGNDLYRIIRTRKTDCDAVRGLKKKNGTWADDPNYTYKKVPYIVLDKPEETAK